MNARKAVIPMLKRALISALIILPILAFIDWASSPLVQSCLAEGTVGTELQQIYNSLIEHRCPYESGVVIEGLRFAASWSPQVWTAIAGMAIALFAVVLGCFTVSLANSTRIAADAATHMAEAAVAAERARLYFIEGENNFMDYVRFAASWSGPSEFEGRPAIRTSICKIQFQKLRKDAGNNSGDMVWTEIFSLAVRLHLRAAEDRGTHDQCGRRHRDDNVCG